MAREIILRGGIVRGLFLKAGLAGRIWSANRSLATARDDGRRGVERRVERRRERRATAMIHGFGEAAANV
jgi:hypothetical protein